MREYQLHLAPHALCTGRLETWVWGSTGCRRAPRARCLVSLPPADSENVDSLVLCVVCVPAPRRLKTPSGPWDVQDRYRVHKPALYNTRVQCTLHSGGMGYVPAPARDFIVDGRARLRLAVNQPCSLYQLCATSVHAPPRTRRGRLARESAPRNCKNRLCEVEMRRRLVATGQREEGHECDGAKTWTRQTRQ